MSTLTFPKHFCIQMIAKFLWGVKIILSLLPKSLYKPKSWGGLGVRMSYDFKKAFFSQTQSIHIAYWIRENTISIKICLLNPKNDHIGLSTY